MKYSENNLCPFSILLYSKMLARFPVHQDKAVFCIAHLLALHNGLLMQASKSRVTLATDLHGGDDTFVSPVASVHASWYPSVIPLAIPYPIFNLTSS